MPAVNDDLMLQAMIVSAKGKTNQIVYWSRLPDWKNQTLTPNPDVDLSDAVLQHEGRRPDGAGDSAGQTAARSPAPSWTRGRRRSRTSGPAGVDKGKGGKYLILPPGYKDKAPDGYIALPSMTYQGYALLRSNLESGSDADVAKAVALRQADQALSAVASRQPAGDDVRRRDRRGVRRDHSLRRALLSSRSTASCRSSRG